MYLSIGFIIIATLLAFITISALSKKLQNLFIKIAEGEKNVSFISKKILDSSKELSTSSQEQASSVEEVSSSLHEISAMVAASVKGSEQSVLQTKNVFQLVNSGTSSMNDLKNSVDEISAANSRVEKLAKLIEEIGEKTTLIDDIVFQTRLLSFNASVEAERAGEHGRGFSVVAQEVGNLAKMSGKSAAEISEIVKSSILEARDVARLNLQRVETSVQLCKTTSEQFQHIEKSSKDILLNAEKVMESSEEQKKGIEQISQSIIHISQSTQNNATSADQSAGDGESLAHEASSLTMVVQDLAQLVYGTNNRGTHEAVSQLTDNITEMPLKKKQPKAHLKSTTTSRKNYQFNSSPTPKASGDSWENL